MSSPIPSSPNQQPLSLGNRPENLLPNANSNQTERVVYEYMMDVDQPLVAIDAW